MKASSTKFTKDKMIQSPCGHFSDNYLRRLGYDLNHDEECFCPSCATTKPKKPKKEKINSKATETLKATRSFEIIHKDSFRPVKRSIRAHAYFVIAICQYSGHIFVFQLSL